jgi:hypothetical protein
MLTHTKTTRKGPWWVAGAGSGRTENCSGPGVHQHLLRKGKLPHLIRDGVPDHEYASRLTEDTAVAGIWHAEAREIGAREAEGGRGNQPGQFLAEEVADHPQHRGAAVELTEAAAETGVGDEAAPARADEPGPNEPRGVLWQEAEEHLLHELIRQRQRRPRPRHGACLSGCVPGGGRWI